MKIVFAEYAKKELDDAKAYFELLERKITWIKKTFRFLKISFRYINPILEILNHNHSNLNYHPQF